MDESRSDGMGAMHGVLAGFDGDLMTARQMATTAHDLDRSGNEARLRTGEVYRWNNRRSVWVR